MQTQKEIKLWQHQELAVSKAKDLNYYALFFEPGCGKTLTLINILRIIYKRYGVICPTIILCPPVAISNWKREILEGSKIKPENIIPLVGTGKQRAALLKNSVQNSIFITNYESLNMPEVFSEMKRILNQVTNSCLGLDESHKTKDISSKRTKRAVELADLAGYRYILTGTPILNDLMDIFSQFRILDRGERFGKNFFSFRAKYFEDKNKFMPAGKHFPNWKPVRGADKLIKELIADCSMFVEKSTCLTLPPFVQKTVEVPMGKEQRDLYESMKSDLIATITGSDGRVRHSIADLAITKSLRLQQIVSGHLKTEWEGGETGKVITIKDNPRKQALKELLEDLAPNHKVLVWAVFHANYDDIRDVCKSLDIEFAELHGLVKDKDSEANRFRTDPKCRVIIGHPGSGGIAINLVEASYMIYYSRSFSLEYDIQSEARAYRGGSTIHEKITRIDLVCRNSIDELVMKSLASKVQISDSILKQKTTGDMMAKKEAKTPYTKGKIYLLRSDIWCVDYTNPDFMIVKARDIDFKLKPEQLEIIDEPRGKK